MEQRCLSQGIQWFEQGSFPPGFDSFIVSGNTCVGENKWIGFFFFFFQINPQWGTPRLSTKAVEKLCSACCVWAAREHSHLSSLEGAVSACFTSPASTSLKHTQNVTLPVVPVVLMGYVKSQLHCNFIFLRERGRKHFLLGATSLLLTLCLSLRVCSMLISLSDNEKCQEPGKPWGSPCGCTAALHQNHRLSPIFSPCSGLGHGLFLLPIVYFRTAGPCILQQSAPSTGNHSVHKLVIQFFNCCPACQTKVLPFGLGFVGSGPSAAIYCTKSFRSLPHRQGTPSPDNDVDIAVAEMEASSQGIKKVELPAGLFPKSPIVL